MRVYVDQVPEGRMRELRDKVAVVTGGASGIGSGICRALAAEGSRVVVADLDGRAADALAQELRGQGARALGLPVDVSDLGSLRKLADTVVSELGGVDVICNNAGVFIGGALADLTADDWRWVMSVNVDGVFYGCKVFVPLLIARGGGHVVNTASVGGFLSSPVAAAYSASKFAVVAFSEALRGDVARHGIGVSILCPGPVRTRLAQSDRHRPGVLADAGNHSEVLWDMIKDGIEPEEAGRIAVRGIRADAPYIFTHPDWKGAFEERFNRVLASFSQV
jgi:NAD(P)-dependent dehydrogenase (short-subunit alcohol dehydrogenase family)